MASPYTSPALSGYNATPPSDDGSTVAANQVTWAKHKTKLADPLRTYIDEINTNVQAAFTSIYGTTSAETSVGATPTNHIIDTTDYSDPRRFGAVPDSSTDSTVAMQKAVNVAIASGRAMRIAGSQTDGEYKITSPLAISGPVQIDGRGERASRLLAVNCSAFEIAAGVASVKMRNFRIAAATRYTTTPHSHVAIDIQGITASQCDWHLYESLLIDGFHTAVVAGALRTSTFRDLITLFGLNGITTADLTDGNKVIGGNFSGPGTTAGVGLKIGDGVAATEGWHVVGATIYGFGRSIWGLGAQNCHLDALILDQFREYALLLQSGAAMATDNWNVSNVYCGAIDADTGVYCVNDVAASVHRGHKFVNVDVFKYLGQTLTNGFLIEGTEDDGHQFVNCSALADSFDAKVTSGRHNWSRNKWLGAGFVATVRQSYAGSNTGTLVSDPNAAVAQENFDRIEKTLTYGTTIATDIDDGNHFTITVTDAVAFTISNPTNPSLRKYITYTIRNQSGGAMGAITWDTSFKMAAFTNPATGTSRSITFGYNGTHLVEVSRTPADVAS